MTVGSEGMVRTSLRSEGFRSNTLKIHVFLKGKIDPIASHPVVPSQIPVLPPVECGTAGQYFTPRVYGGEAVVVW